MSVSLTVGSAQWKCIAGSCVAHGCVTNPQAIRDLNRTCGPDTPSSVEDLASRDYIGRFVPQAFAVTREATMSASTLRTLLERKLQDWGAGPIGTTMFNHFVRGNGEPLLHNDGSALSRLLRENTQFQAFVNSALGLIWEGFQREGLDPTRNHYTFYWQSAFFGWVGFSDVIATMLYRTTGASADQQALRTVIGGTSGFKIFARNLHVPSTTKVTFRLRFEICDHFGADGSDHYSEGLRALWMLQHALPGPQRPFCNLIAVEGDYTLPR